MKKLFGTDGIRGHAGEFPLDEETIRIIGSSLTRRFAERLGRPARFIIGRDTRESGEWIEKAFCDGAVSENAACESAEVITTPGVAFLTKQFEFDAGIVISASHNPYYDNGIKIFLPSGKKLDGASERAIEEDIGCQLSAVSCHRLDVSADRSAEFQTAYLDYLSGQFPDLRLENFKIVVDCANGAASSIAPNLFKLLGANVIAFNVKPNGQNINADCGSLHLEHLQKKVLEENADFGVAFDGDADRALFVDEKGSIVDGDATLWILAQFLQDHGKLANKTVVATVMSNIGLEIALRTRDLTLLRAAVGDKYVLEELLKTDSEIGGEQSGHIIFPEKSLVGDGMMTTLFLLESIFERGISFSETAKGFTKYPQILVNVKVREKTPFEDVPAIAGAAKHLEQELDGCGRLLLRYSGTENLARVMIEGEDQTAIEEQAHRLARVIGSSLG
jgi:phosphoglucosamine mutase